MSDSRTVPAGAYEVRIGTGVLETAGAILASRADPGPVLLVTDENVGPLYLDRVRESVRAADFRPEALVLPAGERLKTLENVRRVYDRLLSVGADRGTPVVALGGGTVGDLAGFAAATWMRGIPWICLPTTLLAQVDASVGGKTAVNYREGKNLVGVFHEPSAVAADLETLRTLPEREFLSGFSEVLKTALALDPELFISIESDPGGVATPEGRRIPDTVVACVRAKVRVVGADLREAGRRRVLNFGHTVGHALEAAAGYGGVLHGEAVAVGMMAAVRLSVKRTGLAPEWEARLAGLLRALGLPVEREDLAVVPEREAVARHLARDKKIRGGRIAMVLLEAPGRPRIVTDVPAVQVLEAVYPP
jgi:3-dehydroquinate synthase